MNSICIFDQAEEFKLGMVSNSQKLTDKMIFWHELIAITLLLDDL